jgi:hypothetical protein
VRSTPTSARPPLAAVPELDRIAADPRCLTTLSKPAITTLLLRASVVQSALVAALAAEEVREYPAVIAQDDDQKMLTADEAAVILRKSRQWIYRHAPMLPFVKRISRKSLLCSEAGIRRWLAIRKV